MNASQECMFFCLLKYIQNIFNVLINSGHIHTRFKPPLTPPKRNTHELLKQYGKQIGIYYAIFLVVATTKQHHKVFANFSLHKLYLNQGKKVSHQCKIREHFKDTNNVRKNAKMKLHLIYMRKLVFCIQNLLVFALE